MKHPKLLDMEEVGYNYQVIANNRDKEAPEVWIFHNKRAPCEYFIKEGYIVLVWVK